MEWMNIWKGIYQKRGGGLVMKQGRWSEYFLPSLTISPFPLYSLYPSSDTGHINIRKRCTKRKGITAVPAVKDEKIWESRQVSIPQVYPFGAAIMGKLGGVNPVTHMCSNFYSSETLGRQNENYAYQDQPRERMRHFSRVRGYISA